METNGIVKMRRSCVVPGDLITLWHPTEDFPGAHTYLVQAVEIFPSYIEITHPSGEITSKTTIVGAFVGLVAHVETPPDWLDKMIWHQTDRDGRFFDRYGMPARSRS